MTTRDHVFIFDSDQKVEEIEKKRMLVEKILLDHYEKVKIKQKENKFLSVVLDNYKKHFSCICEEKQRQYERMSMLMDYIEQITSGMDESDYLLRSSMYDQKALLSGIVELKKDIDFFQIL